MDNNVGQTEEKTKIAAITTSPTEFIAATHCAPIGAKSPSSIITNSTSFWKNSGRAVPGRPSPKRDFLGPKSTSGAADPQRDRGNGSGGMVSTFRDYQQSVSDAWDTGDDEFCIISSTEAAAAAAVGGKQIMKRNFKKSSLYISVSTVP